MSDLAVQHRPRSLLPGLTEASFGFPSWTGWRPLLDNRLLRVEDQMADGRHVMRVEIPGIDPDKDLDITARDGQLTITAQRGEKNESTGRSEFRYGSFVRAVAPAGADENDIKVSYDQGILTVSVAAFKTPARNTYQSSPRGTRSRSTAHAALPKMLRSPPPQTATGVPYWL